MTEATATATAEGNEQRMVPLTALEAERRSRQRAEVEAAELRGRLSAASGSDEGSKKEEKTYTRAQLRAAVDKGQITEAEMDRLLDAQQERRVTEKVTQEVGQTIRSAELANRVGSELMRYREAVPELLQDDSEQRERVRAEYADMVALGHPADISTELIACRTVLGRIDGLERARREHGRETHEEVGGRGEGGEKQTSGAPKNLSAAQRAHYQRLIDRGLYKGWDDPRLQTEAKHVKPRRSAA